MDKQINNIIEVKNLTVAFGDFKAVDNISFCVKRGEIFGFLGANGAGKTTTIRTICGILNPTSGEVFVDGKDISSNTKILKPFIGYMSQKFTLYDDLSIKENLFFAGSLYNLSKEEITQRAEAIFKFIGLKNDIKGLVKNLPGGVKQMVALCSTLINNPTLIFLDEPTAGTSPLTRRDFWNLIKILSSEGKTIFVTTHYMDEAEFCDKIALMEKGKIIALDSPQKLKETFFKDNLFRLTFLKPQINETLQEIKELALGDASVFADTIRIAVNDGKKFNDYASSKKDVFIFKKSTPTLEDVFLKAIGGAR